MAGMLISDECCRRCYGDGKRDDGSICYACQGAGRELTELGRELLSLLRERFGLTPKDGQ